MSNYLPLRPAIHAHSKRCLTKAMKTAIENLRDASETDFDFRIMVQNNEPLGLADEYLHTGTVQCVCPPCDRFCCQELPDWENNIWKDAEYRG